MPTFLELDRARTHERDRTRPNASGNFITLTKGGNLYGLLVTPTPENYVKYTVYPKVDSHPFGYVFDPPGPNPFVLIGPAINEPDLVPSDIVTPSTIPQPPAPSGGPVNSGVILSPVPLSPDVLPTAKEAVQVAAFEAGDASTKLTSITPQQIISSYFPIKQVMIRALPTNAGDIWVNFRPNVAINDGFLLAKGEGRVLNINDLSRIYFIGANATDRFEFTYFV